VHLVVESGRSAIDLASGEIDRLERQEIQSFQYRRYYDVYMWLGLSALCLFVGVQLLEMTFWQRIP